MTTANSITSMTGSESCNTMTVGERGQGNSIKTVVFTLPAHWAGYLINNDASSFCLEDGANGSPATVDVINDWMQREGLGACLDCSDESFFTWHPDFPKQQGATCLDYIFTLNA